MKYYFLEQICLTLMQEIKRISGRFINLNKKAFANENDLTRMQFLLCEFCYLGHFSAFFIFQEIGIS